MAVNPETGVDYDNDRFAIWRPSLSDYTHTNTTWPRLDGGPRTGGLLYDYLYYKRTESERPDVDHRYRIDTTWERVDTDPLPPEGHPQGQYLQTHEVVKYDTETLKTQVENEFQRQLQVLFPASNDPAVLIEAAHALALKQSNATLTPDQEAKLALVNSVGDQVTQMRARQTALYAAIDNDEDYDITEGWIAA